MNTNRISFFIIAGILAFIGLIWMAFDSSFINPSIQSKTYAITEKWEMPKELDEISGISWISEAKIACVQDEDGIIFIYNLDKNQIEKRIKFSKPGDYEALAIIDSTAYIMESSGKLFEVANYLSPEFKTKEYQTPFSAKNNMESLVADTLNNRLLFTVKDKDPNSNLYKGIYAFNLETKKTEKEPIFKIHITDSIFGKNNLKKDGKKGNNFYPSGIGINPINGNIYVLEGKNPKLLIFNDSGKILKLYHLNKKLFPQPEGITFSSKGIIYIANEGKNGTANILEVMFDE